MDNIILINKDKNMTSREVCDKVSKLLNEKKVGHFGTLDPMATGLLVIGLGKLTKLSTIIENHDKEYEVEVLIGKSTDTYDITGKTIIEDYKSKIDEQILKEAIKSFIGTYLQEVPKYSAVRVNGKRLYEYARENIEVILPKKEVTIYSIENINFFKRENKNYLSFKTKVSSGTYIRSLINDISKKINIPLCMSALNRTMCCNLYLDNAYTLDNIKNNNYKLLNIEDILDITIMEVPSDLEKYIINGNKIKKISKKMILFKKDDKNIALYKVYNNYMKPVLIFKN